MPQPPYSPDLAPAENNESVLSTIEGLKEKLKQELLAITKSPFEKCCEDWQKTLA